MSKIREKEIELDGVLAWVRRNYWNVIAFDLLFGFVGCMLTLLFCFLGLISWTAGVGWFRAFTTLFVFTLVFGFEE